MNQLKSSIPNNGYSEAKILAHDNHPEISKSLKIAIEGLIG